MNSVQAAARIAEIQELQNDLSDERAFLERLVDRPRVDVTLVFWRRFTLYREVSEDTVERALAYLQQASEDGDLSYVGVEVDGVMYDKEWGGVDVRPVP